MDETIRKRIWEAVDEIESNPELLRKISPTKHFYLDEKGHPKFDSTHWQAYYLIKSLDLGHRPTREETREVMFYSVAKLIGDGDASRGIKKVISNLRRKND